MTQKKVKDEIGALFNDRKRNIITTDKLVQAFADKWPRYVFDAYVNEIIEITNLDKDEVMELYDKNKDMERLDKIRKDIFDVMFSDQKMGSKKDEITEILVNSFMKDNYIYTIRSDEKREMWIYKNGIYISKGETYIKEFCRKILGSSHRHKYVNPVIEKIEADTYVDSNDFFNIDDPYKIACQNGIVDLKTGELEEFSPDKKHFNKINAFFDESATIDRIDTFLHEILPARDVKIIQEMMGFCLVRDYFLEKMFMFEGDGGNGKSCLMKLIKTFLGHENCTGVALKDIANKGFSVCELHNKMVNLAGEVSNRIIKDTDTIKRITGGDWLTVDRKFKEHISFKNYAKIINACNELPKTLDDTDAFFRRWIHFEFPNKFVPQDEYEIMEKENTEEEMKNIYVADENIIEKITSKDELSGLLNWSIKGLEHILDKGFSESKTTQDKRIEWLRKSNSFESFCMDCLTGGDIDDYISKRKLKGEYMKYCRHNKVSPEPDRVIKAILIKRFGTYDGQKRMDDGNRSRVWYGVNLKYDTEPDVHEMDKEKDKGMAEYTKDKDNNNKNVSELGDTIKEKIINLVKQKKEIPTQDIITIMDNKTDIGPQTIEKNIKKLLSDGKIFEPRAGLIQIN